MDNKWKFDDIFFQFESVEPIFVESMQGQYDVWYDVTEQCPSTKQIAAWNEFCNLLPYDLREQFIRGFTSFEKQWSMLSKNSNYNPKIIKKLVRKTIFTFQKSNLPLGNIDSSVFRCNSLVIPLQENSHFYLVLMNFELGIGKISNQSYGFEMEGLFCNGQLLFIGENSGLWSRLEWEEEFNTSLFEPTSAYHPYWKYML